MITNLLLFMITLALIANAVALVRYHLAIRRLHKTLDEVTGKQRQYPPTREGHP